MNVHLRPQASDSSDDDFVRRLFFTLDANQSLLAIDERLIEMQHRSREQQYRVSFPNASFEIILFGDDAIGRIVMDRTERSWTLVDMIILPDYRCRSIGSQVVGALLDDARGQGKAVIASVMAENIRGQQFWIRAGFRLTDRGSDYHSLLYSP